MSITISEQVLLDLLEESSKSTQQLDASDPLDITKSYPQEIGQGYIREILLRQGLKLEIVDLCFHNQLCIKYLAERADWLEYHFHISGQHIDKRTTVASNQYALYGTGILPEETETINCSSQCSLLEIVIRVRLDVLHSFIAQTETQLPTELQHLVRVNQEGFARVSEITPVMKNVLWQILRCPYKGMTKRIYLESKALELIGLSLEQEIAVWAGKPLQPLQLGTVERIHHARAVLLQNLHSPPSLMELARQVKLNEYALKQGFRQVFGTTVFGYLHDYRLEQARQLLESGNLKIIEVAEMVGFSSRSYFALAFKKKFGVNPKDYRQHGAGSGIS